MSMGAIGGAVAATVVGGAMTKKGGGGGSAGGVSNEFILEGNPYFEGRFDKRKGMDDMRMNATGALGDLQAGLFKDADMFNEMARNNEGADLARSMGMDFLGNMGAFDPAEIAQMQFDILDPILAERQQDDVLNMEQRQFAQGRLGSTGGANDFGAMYDSHEDARRKLLSDSFGQGLAAQNQQFSLGTGLLQLDPTLRGLFQNLGGNSLTGGLNIQTSANDVFSAMSGAGGGGVSSGGGMNPMSSIGAGLMNSGVNGLANSAAGLFQPSQNIQSTPQSAYGGYNGAYMPGGGGNWNSAGGGI